MRSFWKGVFINVTSLKYDNKLYEKKYIKDKKIKIRVGSRNTTLLSSMLQHTFSVYNGKTFIPLAVHSGMLGFKFGDFVFTKRTGGRIHAEKGKKRGK